MFTQPIDLGWSEGCAEDPHCGISSPKEICKRWVADSALEMPSLWPSSRPKLVSAARSLQPPIYSTTSGLKDMPTERQVSAWAACHLPFLPHREGMALSGGRSGDSLLLQG